MSSMAGIGLPGRKKIRKTPRITTRAQAQRLRFGILAARDTLERNRLTPDQVDYLENCAAVGWRKEDAWAAYRREAIKAARRTNVGL